MDLKKAIFSLWVRCYLYNNRYVLDVRRKRKNSTCKWAYDILLVAVLPYLVLRWCLCVIFETVYGKRAVYRVMESERSKAFLHDVGLVAIMKNEGPYLHEWIEFHKLVGITKFYLYDNESEDNTRHVLQPYVDSGLVEYIFFPGKARQLDAYNDAVSRHKEECRWMCFLDVDEFLMPVEPFKTVAEIVSDIISRSGKGAAGVSVNWAVYGSSHFEEKPQGLVMDNFVNRAMPTHWSCFIVKTICNPRMVVDFISPHYPLYRLGAYSVNDSNGKRQYGWFCHNVAYERLRVNHYFVKSREEFMRKRSRGLADRDGEYEMEIFDKYDLNDIHDEVMKSYSAIIRKIDE